MIPRSPKIFNELHTDDRIPAPASPGAPDAHTPLSTHHLHLGIQQTTAA